MAFRIVAILMTLSDLQGHSPEAHTSVDARNHLFILNDAV